MYAIRSYYVYDEDDIYCFEEEEGLLRVKTVFKGDGKSEEIIIKNILASLNPRNNFV